jgi:hypothetical protein
MRTEGLCQLLAFSGQSCRAHVCPLSDQSGQRWILVCVGLSANDGGLNRSTQHFIFNGKDGVSGDQSKISSRIHCGRENGVVGALAAGGVAQSDWAGVWQAVIFHLLPGGTARGDSSCATASLAVGIDGLRARGDIEGRCGASIGTIDGQVTGPLAVDGEPRTQPEWRP